MADPEVEALQKQVLALEKKLDDQDKKLDAASSSKMREELLGIINTLEGKIQSLKDEIAKKMEEHVERKHGPLAI